MFRRGFCGWSVRGVCCAVVAGWFAAATTLCAHERSDAVAQLPQVRLTIEAIWKAEQTHFEDRGELAGSVEQLMEAGYLHIDSAVSANWVFAIHETLPQTIRAFTKPLHDESPPDLSLEYNTCTGKWFGDGVPDYGRETLTADQQADLACPAIGAVYAIAQSAAVYHDDRGMWPESPDDLVRERYLQIPPGAVQQWSFGWIGDSLSTVIVAISTDLMPGGAGHTIAYDRNTRTWRGYGLGKVSESITRCAPVYIDYAAPKVK
jgi:hypothetical protein